MKVGVSSQRPISPPIGRPPAYGKFAMDEWIKTGNTQNVFIRHILVSKSLTSQKINP